MSCSGPHPSPERPTSSLLDASRPERPIPSFEVRSSEGERRRAGHHASPRVGEPHARGVATSGPIVGMWRYDAFGDPTLHDTRRCERAIQAVDVFRPRFRMQVPRSRRELRVTEEPLHPAGIGLPGDQRASAVAQSVEAKYA